MPGKIENKIEDVTISMDDQKANLHRMKEILESYIFQMREYVKEVTPGVLTGEFVKPETKGLSCAVYGDRNLAQ